MPCLWDPSTDLELEKLLTARDKLKTCIDGIRNECREREGPSEKLNELKTRRTKHRREVMDQARNCTKKLQYIFSEGFESVSLKAIVRDIDARVAARTCAVDEWRSVLVRLSRPVRAVLTRVSCLHQTETSLKQDVAQLETWHVRGSGYGVSILGNAEAYRKELKRSHRARDRLKSELEDAEDNDVEEIGNIKLALQKKGEEIKAMQAKLDSGFSQAAKDLLHFPEQSLELAKMMEGPPALLRYWKEMSFKDFAQRPKRALWRESSDVQSAETG
jgi:hypothetical protein